MMSFERRVAMALKIIGPKADHAAVEKAVAVAMGEPPRRLRLLVSGGVYFQPQNETDKEGMAQLHAALRRVETLLGQKRLQTMFEKEPDLDQWKAKLGKMKRAAAEFSQRPLSRPKPSKPQKRRAAELAAELLDSAGLPLTVSRHSQFNKLAAALLGDLAANLFTQCRAVRADRNRV